MSVKCFVLSTPDLCFDHLVDSVAHELNWHVYPESLVGGRDDDSIEVFHNRLLGRIDKSWYEHIDQQALLLNQSLYQDDISEITERLGSHSCLIHHPLLCRSLPMWASSSPSAKVLLRYSEPLECALSLQRDWRMPIAVGLALWESYIIDACKSLVDRDYKLLTLNDLISSPETNFNSLIDWLTETQDLSEDSRSISWPKSTQLKSLEFVTSDELEGCLQQAQIEILEHLKMGAVNAIAERNLSFSSADILEYYGQLRGALEHANGARDNFKIKYLEAQNRELLSESSDVVRHEEIQLDQLSSQDRLCNVKVQLEGMETLEFSSTLDSPVLEMLHTHLSSSTEDQMIYLNYGETGDEALYFMSSSLLAIETELT